MFLERHLYTYAITQVVGCFLFFVFLTHQQVVQHGLENLSKISVEISTHHLAV